LRPNRGECPVSYIADAKQLLEIEGRGFYINKALILVVGSLNMDQVVHVFLHIFPAA